MCSYWNQAIYSLRRLSYETTPFPMSLQGSALVLLVIQEAISSIKLQKMLYEYLCM